MNRLLETPGAQVAARSPAGPRNPSQRILVVEDEPAIRQFNAQVLVRSGYQVDAAEDGAAGWEALRENNFDLLVTDYSMPKVTGLELVKRVRSARMTLPVILATGALPEEELERHPWLQLAATLLKPFSSHQLLATVREVLRMADCASLGLKNRLPLRAVTFSQTSPHQHGGLQ